MDEIKLDGKLAMEDIDLAEDALDVLLFLMHAVESDSTLRDAVGDNIVNGACGVADRAWCTLHSFIVKVYASTEFDKPDES